MTTPSLWKPQLGTTSPTRGHSLLLSHLACPIGDLASTARHPRRVVEQNLPATGVHGPRLLLARRLASSKKTRVLRFEPATERPSSTSAPTPGTVLVLGPHPLVRNPFRSFNFLSTFSELRTSEAVDLGYPLSCPLGEGLPVAKDFLRVLQSSLPCCLQPLNPRNPRLSTLKPASSNTSGWQKTKSVFL